MLALLLLAAEVPVAPTAFDPWASIANMGPMGITLASIAYIVRPLVIRYMDEIKLSREQNQLVINEFRSFMNETVGATKLTVESLKDLKQGTTENGRLINLILTNEAVEADRKTREPRS